MRIESLSIALMYLLCCLYPVDCHRTYGPRMITEWKQVPVSRVGRTLDEVIMKMGKWIPVSDTGPVEDGPIEYSFFTRNGYDYPVFADNGNGDKVVRVLEKKLAVKVKKEAN